MNTTTRTLLLLVTVLLVTVPAYGQEFEVEAPQVALTGIPFDVAIRSTDGSAPARLTAGFSLQVGSDTYPVVSLGGGELAAEGIILRGTGVQEVALMWDGTRMGETSTRVVPGWLSIIPPLLAIIVALAFRNVIPALFLGIWFGSWAIVGLSIGGLWRGLLDTYQVYVLGAITDPSRASIILFSFMIGGMVGIISKNGGMQGVVNRIIPWASTPKRGQVATAALGLIIFFDDYANTLVVGNTMRKVTDRLRISREKLAYIVDSTAAPVTCVAFVTTWIGYEVGLIGISVERLEGFSEAPYSVFLSSIPYNFYPLLAMFFVFVVALSQRDFGPMYKAEVRARTKGQVLSPDADVDEAAVSGKELRPRQDKPHRPLNAVIPVLVLIVSVLGGLYVTGEGESLRDIIGSADSYKALMWASLLSALSAFLLSVGQRILTLHETVEAWYAGLKSMLFAMIILVLAWSLSSVSEVLHTADFLVSILGEALHPGIVPALVFVLSAATAFATGSSWGTMGILMPLVLPLTWAVLLANGTADPSHYHIIYSTVACVLAGAVWGDHCSPISDTTILSSMASGCDHIDHVRTQLPYAMTVGGVGILLGTLPTGFGLPWWIALPAGAVVLLALHRYLGKKVVYGEIDEEESTAPASS